MTHCMNARGAAAALLCLCLQAAPARAAEGAVPQLRIELGRHLGAVRALSSDATGRLLLSGGDDRTARIWDAGGAPLAVLRPPSEDGAEGLVEAAALSPDGRRAALVVATSGDGQGNRAALLLYDRASGRMLRRVSVASDAARAVFSPDGARLAIALGRYGVQVLSVPGAIVQRFRGDAPDGAFGVDFDGKGRLVTCDLSGRVRLYDAALQLQAEAQVDGAQEPLSVRFSPRGDRVALGYGGAPRVDVLSGEDLAPLYRPDVAGVSGGLGQVAWSLDGQTLYAGGTYRRAASPNMPEGPDAVVRAWSAQGKGPAREGGCAASAIWDLAPMIGGVACAGSLGSLGALGPDGRLLRAPAAAPPRVPPEGLLVDASGERVRLLGRRGGVAAELWFSLPDRALGQGEAPAMPGAAPQPPVTSDAKLPLKDWRDREDVSLGGAPLLPSSAVRAGLGTAQLSRAVAIAQDGFLLGTTWELLSFNRLGAPRWGAPLPAGAQAVNLSGDGRLALALLEDGGLSWYRKSDGQLLLSLVIHPDRRRWIALTPGGYYDASAGGEDFVGWLVGRGPQEAPDFFSAASFRQRFYRPDVVARVLRLLDEDKARAEADAAAGRAPPKVAQGAQGAQAAQTAPVAQVAAPARLLGALPPVLTLLSPEDGSALGEPRATVRLAVRQPGGGAVALRALIDGRTVARTQLPPPPPGETAQRGEQVHTVTIPVPARDCTLTLIAEGDKGASEPRAVHLRWRATPSRPAEQAAQPKLYVLAIGVGAYRQRDLQLTYPAKDARDLAAALREQSGRLFRAVEVRTILDGEARRDAILSGLEWLRRQATDKDVAVLFLAGHGFNDPGSGEYYFLPHDGDPGELLRTMVPGALLRSALAGLSGKALLLLDTCFAGQVFPGRSFRGAADSTRFINELAAADSGVVVMAAASGRQVAQESRAWGNGAFTKAIIEGLRGKADYGKTGRITLNMLDLYVSERVKELTRGLQTPTSARPSAVADFPLALLR